MSTFQTMVTSGGPAVRPETVAASRAGWWRCLFEGSEDAQVVCGRDGWIWELNRRAARLLGLKPEEIAAATLFESLTPAAGKKLSELLTRRSGHQETLSSVTLMSGGRLSMIADFQVMPLAENCQLVTIKDASRRWRMESHVQRLVTAVDATPDVFFLTDAEFKLVFVNAAFQTVTGHTIEEALGRTADFLRAPGEEQKAKEYLAAVKDGRDWVGELWNRRNDGSVFPVAVTISPVQDRNGDLLGYVSCERDITARKRLQDEVLRERNFTRSIVNSLDSAIYTVDRNFRLTHANEGWKKLPAQHGFLKVHQAPLPGVQLLDFVTDPARRLELKGRFESVLCDRRAVEIQSSSPDGRHWLVRISPWHHAGEVSGLIYHVIDQTQFHELQSQLYQAQKMETIGALAAGVAHDFNNLLQVIRGNSSLMLMNGETPPALRPRLEQIDRAASRAADITQQLLSFSRASDEKVTVFDFNQIVDEASQLARRSLKGNVELELCPSPAPLKVKMDATRASQVLLNLCVNAQDAMPNGGKLRLASTLVELPAEKAARTTHRPGTRFVHCTVEDSGTGIPPEILARIFDPFFTTKEKGKGTGLGLSIAHSVVAQAGGFLEVESVVGQGTVFHIYLPTVDAALTASPLPPQAGLERCTGRVMVVDDLDLVRDFTQSFLRAAGFDVIVAEDANSALARLDQEVKPVDLLLTDYNMPGMNGFELIKTIKVRWPGMKFVLASGFLEPDEREVMERDYGVRILHKPYNLREATNLIREALASPPAASVAM